MCRALSLMCQGPTVAEGQSPPWRLAPGRRSQGCSQRRSWRSQPPRRARHATSSPRPAARTSSESSPTRCARARPAACAPVSTGATSRSARAAARARPPRSGALPGRARHGAWAACWVADSANHVVDPAALPRRAQRRQPAEPDASTANSVVFRDNDVTNAPHDDLLRARHRRVRPRARHGDRAQPHPQLRPAAADEPPPRDLRRGLRRRAHHRQLDLRQRRPRRAAVPGRAAHLRRPQRDRRQRTGHHLRAQVRATTWSRTT